MGEPTGGLGWVKGDDMAIPLLGALIQPISDLLTKGLDKIAVDRNVKLQIETDFKKSLEEYLHSEAMAFEQRVLTEYENPNKFRDSVRPVITYCSWILYMFYKVVTIFYLTKVFIPILKATKDVVSLVKATQEYSDALFNEYDIMILLAIIGFWFGGKVFERMKRLGKPSLAPVKTGGIFRKISEWFTGKPKEE